MDRAIGFATTVANATMKDCLRAKTYIKMKMKKKKEEEKNSKAEEVKQDLVDVLENVEETTDVALTVGGEDDSQVENTRAALVDFVRARLGKTTK